MCGFLAEFNDNTRSLSSREQFLSLLELSHHRGPDATQIEKGQNFQFGFNRLSILDLSANGNQPKYSPSRRYTLVFNGEIYNFKTLTDTYGLKNLKSTSDTEVIAHLFDEIGVEATIKELNGMFAIAVIDQKTNLFSLARDFAGIKPLFYGLGENGIVAASQFDQVFKHPWIKQHLELRPEIVKEYFGFGYMQAPNTIYDNVFQVNPGELITFKGNKCLSNKQLVTFPKSLNATYKETSHTSKLYNTLLDRVLKRQLISDVPIASFLSGGIDSPLITAHAKANKDDIEAFTLKVANTDLDESDIATEYATELSINQKIIKANPSDILEEMEDFFDKCPEPFGDYSSLPTYLISKHAVKNHKVMLSGDGGDELFYGYPRFSHIAKNRIWFKIPFKLRRQLVSFLKKFKVITTPAPYYYKTISEWQVAKNLQVFPDILDKLVPNTSFSNELKSLYQLDGSKSKKALLHALRHNEFYAHMQRVLIKVDRASMANSLEVRVPFLDKESIDFSWQLESDLLKHNTLKKVLKECLGHYVPESLINMKKMGFTVPLEDWLHNELKEDVWHHIFEIPFYGAEFLDVNYLKSGVKNFYNSKGPFSSWSIWHIYAWQKWAVTHVKA